MTKVRIRQGKPLARQSKVSMELAATLPAGQRMALETLRLGKSAQESAERVGVDRTTIYRWIRTDPNFQAAYNQWQEEVKEWQRARLLKLSDIAVDAVERDLQRGNSKLAMRVLDRIGLLEPTREKLTEPDDIRRKMALDSEQDRMVLEKEERDLKAIKRVWRNEDTERRGEDGAAGNLDDVPTDELIEMAKKNDPGKWGRGG